MWFHPSFSGWFTGLSSKFLSARTARLLVLAGAERLDKELMIGQMQGKFQLMVMGGVGHMLQEVSLADNRYTVDDMESSQKQDDPTSLAEIVVEFWRRNERVIAGVKKVGDL